MLNYRGLGNRAEEYAGKEEKEMKNWNKPEVEELDVRCTEGGVYGTDTEYYDDKDGAWTFGKKILTNLN